MDPPLLYIHIIIIFDALWNTSFLVISKVVFLHEFILQGLKYLLQNHVSLYDLHLVKDEHSLFASDIITSYSYVKFHFIKLNANIEKSDEL